MKIVANIVERAKTTSLQQLEVRRKLSWPTNYANAYDRSAVTKEGERERERKRERERMIVSRSQILGPERSVVFEIEMERSSQLFN